MARSYMTRDVKSAGAENAPRKSRIQRMHGRLGQCAVGISTTALGIAVAAMAMAQSGKSFKMAPKSPEAEAAEAAAAAGTPDMILGVPVNTIFFVAAGVIALFWFTLGGGRKPKISRNP